MQPLVDVTWLLPHTCLQSSAPGTTTSIIGHSTGHPWAAGGGGHLVLAAGAGGTQAESNGNVCIQGDTHIQGDTVVAGRRAAKA